MMNIKLLPVIAIILLLASCGKNDKNSEYKDDKTNGSQQQTNTDPEGIDKQQQVTEEKKEPVNETEKLSEEKSNDQNSTNTKRYENFEDEKPVAVISPLDAGDYNGKTVTVKGFVADIYKNDKVAYLNFVEKYPNNPFTGVIFARVFDDFPEITKFKNKNVELTGRVSVFKGKPQIIINKPSQLKIN